MATTRTGAFPIGFRRLGGKNWQQDTERVIAFARENDFAFVDLHRDADNCAAAFTAAGLGLGSVDLPEWRSLAAADPDERNRAVERCRTYIETCAAVGARRFFVVMQAETGEGSREEKLNWALAGYDALAEVLEAHDAWIVLEGCPGADVLACTPESFRVVFERCRARLGVNYDPSHLIRMGIDPIRFLREFAPRVKHVHAKDTEIFPEALYEHGHQVPALAAAPHGFGGHYWRYAIPGHGCMRWREAFAVLQQAGYRDGVSIELEDENFNGDEEGERLGLILSRRFLEGC